MTQDSTQDLRQFVEQLLAVSNNAQDQGAVTEFSKKYKDLIPQVAIAMWQVGLVGEVGFHPDEIETCDLCGSDVEELFVDGNTIMGEWANMCQDCYSSQGQGIGWGIGQLYVKDGDNFLCIAGGDPHPEHEAEE